MDEDRLRELQNVVQEQLHEDMKKEKEILLKGFKSLRKHLIL